MHAPITYFPFCPVTAPISVQLLQSYYTFEAGVAIFTICPTYIYALVVNTYEGFESVAVVSRIQVILIFEYLSQSIGCTN